MQQSNRMVTPQERLNARRLAESNFTMNHFLGAARRPWMTNAMSVPSLISEREVIGSRPIRSTGDTSTVPGSTASGVLEENTGPTAQGQGIAGCGTSGAAAQEPASLQSNEVTRKRSIDNAELELDTRCRTIISHPQQPVLVSPAPSSEMRPSPVGLRKKESDPAQKSASVGHVTAPVSSTSTSPSPYTPSQTYALSETSIPRRASASIPCTLAPQQYRGQTQLFQPQNNLSRSQSANNLRIDTQIADNTARSASIIQNLPSSMSTPTSSIQYSSPGLVGNFATLLAGHVGQQSSAPQRRRGRPPLANRAAVPHITPFIAQRGDHSARGSRGGPVTRGRRVGSQFPAEKATTNTTLFFPALGQEPIHTTNPNPSYVALHQAYLRSPTVEKISKADKCVADVRLYQYLKDFAILPRVIDFGSTLIRWHFVVSASEFSKKAVDITSPDGQVKRLISDGRILYRFRSAEVGGFSLHTIEQGEWNIRETSWPPSCFVRINDIDVELRRKIQHGKDLPIDLTPHIREGRNDITIALLRGTIENTLKRYLMAVEVVEIADQTRVDAAPTIADASLRSITQGLTSPNAATIAGDDEVQVVDSHISIDLIDPFMATIFEIPARGRGCTHRECFDLQTFFQTRKSRVKGGPTSPDEWRCPICKLDARPHTLVVDSFLKAVRDSLVTSGAATDARAILIGADGSWKVKREGSGDAARTREQSSATVAESPAGGAVVTGNLSRSMGAVIEIEDD